MHSERERSVGLLARLLDNLRGILHPGFDRQEQGGKINEDDGEFLRKN